MASDDSVRSSSSDASNLTRRNLLIGSTALAAGAATVASMVSSAAAQAQTAAAPSGKKPNILVIFGDDIGIPQISAYTMGLMGYRTPNIDRTPGKAQSSPIPMAS